MMEYLADCLNDISNINIIYTVILIATATNINIDAPEASEYNNMDYNTSLTDSMTPDAILGYATTNDAKPCLLIRIIKRLALVTDNLVVYLQSQFSEHTVTSIASISVLIIVCFILTSIIVCYILNLVREEDRKIKEQYKKMSSGSSQSFIAIGAEQKLANHKICSASAFLAPGYNQLGGGVGGSGAIPSVNRSGSHKLHVIELRRETYFGLVRLLKPGCRTIVLLCDTQSRLKLLTKFYQCIYPYRKNKTLQFAFLLIEKNMGWYKDLLKLALNEKRDLHINPINCIGTVLVLNGFKKYFSVYHASDSRCDPDEPFILLEESLLDNFSDWLERLFAGRASRYYVKYWPEQMR